MSTPTLEDRISQLESNAVFEATQKAVREREIEFLATLKQIRTQMDAERNNNDNNNNNTTAQSSIEIDALKAENTALKAQVAKQQYRIEHLIKSMEAKQIYK